MANFINPAQVVIGSQVEFGAVTTNTLQKFTCKKGETAGFQIIQVGTHPDGSPYYVSQVFDCSSGSNILKGGAAIMPYKDLTGGLFSSGVLPSSDPQANGTIFYKVDY